MSLSPTERLQLRPLISVCSRMSMETWGHEATTPWGHEVIGPSGYGVMGPGGYEARGPGGLEAMGQWGQEALGPWGMGLKYWGILTFYEKKNSNGKQKTRRFFFIRLLFPHPVNESLYFVRFFTNKRNGIYPFANALWL
jgi:hypothetical protein